MCVAGDCVQGSSSSQQATAVPLHVRIIEWQEAVGGSRRGGRCRVRSAGVAVRGRPAIVKLVGFARKAEA
jgi:hypothetical protein